VHSLMLELLNLLGKHVNSREVTRVVHDWNLSSIYDDPPFRQYIGSKTIGLNLLFHEGTLIDVQFHVKATTNSQAFAGALPFGLTRGMFQNEVHKLLGEPVKSNTSQSFYTISEPPVKFVVEYDGSNEMRYISAGLVKIN
jgi:hypothetical protein